MPPIVMALIPTVLLLVWMGFFMMGSLPLLVLKHDTPLDSRFIRGLFNVYYLAVMLTASAAALGFAWTAKPAFALGMAKKLIHMAAGPSLDEYLEWESMVQPQMNQTADHAEGVAAGPAERMPVADREAQVILEPPSAHDAILVVPTECEQAFGVLAAIGERRTRPEEFR